MQATTAPSTRRSPSHPTGTDRDREPHYELCFADLFNAGHSFAFPCDAEGNVDIDRLSERARANYFYARTAIGREFFSPVRRWIEVGGGA